MAKAGKDLDPGVGEALDEAIQRSRAHGLAVAAPGDEDGAADLGHAAEAVMGGGHLSYIRASCFPRHLSRTEPSGWSANPCST